MKFQPSTQTIAWFRDQFLTEKLIIKPPYQRKPVWVARQKCALIESILKELPVPEIYVQRTTTAEDDSLYAVVDGQQRVRTVLQFIGAETDPEESESNRFILEKLPNESTWKNRGIADFTPDERRSFFGYSFAVRFLDTDNEAEVRDMFKRLNRFLTPLNPQELRNATYMGPFAELAVKLADDVYWVENRLVTAALIRRMKDVEFVSDLLIGVMYGPQGGSATVLDSYYERLEDFEDEFPEQRRLVENFGATLSIVKELYADLRGTRWSNRTDFYSLFIAIAELFHESDRELKRPKMLREKLDLFAKQVYERLKNETAKADPEVVKYVRAVEKGANDKNRRADRHEVLKQLLEPFLVAKKK
jgi:hypothetical protein